MPNKGMNIDSEIAKLYEQNKSLQDIADELGCSKVTVFRKLKKMGVQIRNKSEAQKNRLDSGKVRHPTKGTVRSDDCKLKISEKIHDRWQNLSDEEMLAIIKQSRDRWNSMSYEKREEMHKSALAGVRRAAEDGSKIERHLYSQLIKAGYNVLYHKTSLISNTQMELDMLIPELKTVIEVDGPSHFLPVWGEDKLELTIKSDMEKNGMLLNDGYVVIRLKHHGGTISQYILRTAFKILNKELLQIKEKFPEPKNRLIERIVE